MESYENTGEQSREFSVAKAVFVIFFSFAILIGAAYFFSYSREKAVDEGWTNYTQNISVLNGEEVDPADPDKLHFGGLPIAFFIENPKYCGDYESNRIRRAFSTFQNQTKEVVTFKEVYSEAEANIVFNCSFIEDCYKTWVTTEQLSADTYSKTTHESICEHSLGLAQITRVQGNTILKAHIEMIGLAGFSETTGDGVSGFSVGNCGHTNTEVHEILHTFGYEHINLSESIMSPSEEGVGLELYKKGQCEGSEKRIDEILLWDLNKTYYNYSKG